MFKYEKIQAGITSADRKLEHADIRVQIYTIIVSSLSSIDNIHKLKVKNLLTSDSRN
jgi:hypothetical protein